MRLYLITIITALTLIPLSHATSGSSAAATVLPYEIQANNIAYLRFGTFTKDIGKFVRPTIKEIMGKHPRGLIIDVRGNQRGEASTVHALLETILPKGTPYMRQITSVRTLAVTAQIPLVTKSLPIVVLRDERTVNEPDILVYVLQKIRKAKVVEFSPYRAALKRLFKQDKRMSQYLPIKEGVFFVTPDTRVIGEEGADESDVIPAAVKLVRDMSPWDEARKP